MIPLVSDIKIVLFLIIFHKTVAAVRKRKPGPTIKMEFGVVSWVIYCLKRNATGRNFGR
jgi:hypothetical protein